MAQPAVVNLEFQFLGNSYKIRCPKENKLKLEKAAELLQNQIGSLAEQGTDQNKQAIMAALFLSYDYLEESGELRNIRDELKILREEIAGIDRASNLSVSDAKQLLKEMK